MIVDTSVYLRTIQTTATHIDKFVDTSIDGVYDGGISFTDYETLKIDTSMFKQNRDPKVYRNDTHEYADASMVEKFFDKADSSICIWDRDVSIMLDKLKSHNPYKDLYDALKNASK